MKLVVAIIRPETLQAVQTAVDEVEANILCVSQVLGDRRDGAWTMIHRGKEVRVPQSKLRVEIVVSNDHSHLAVETIARAAVDDSGRRSTGNIFVMQLEECDGDPDEVALEAIRA